MNKEVLRSLFLEKRKTLTDKELNRRNELLYSNSLSFLKSNEHLIHCHIFLPIDKFNEPNTWPIFEYILGSDKRSAYVSKTQFKEKSLSHFLVEKDTKLEKSKFGIPEPANGIEALPEILQVVFVPLICCDKEGNRIGYGAGLYDRFLSEVNDQCIKVGLGITPKLDNIDYTSAHDVPLDYFISHLGIDRF